MTIEINPPFSTININGHTYTNAMWEANPQGTFSAIANDIGALLAGLPGSLIPAGGLAGEVLVKLSGTDYDFDWGQRPINAMFFVPGGFDSDFVLRLTTGDKFKIPFSFLHSYAWVRIASSMDVDIDINKIESGNVSSLIGTLTFGTGDLNGTFTPAGSSTIIVEESDMLELVFPSSGDLTITDISVVIRGAWLPPT